jgi:hypothetical protein
MTASLTGLGANLLIPDLLRGAPQVRGVLDRYGLRGCGGALGPHESLGFFAQAHDVPLDRLLREIRAEMERPTSAAAPATAANRADAIYRPFFRAGIAVALSLGAAWGAFLLLRIAFEHSFRAAGLHEVNAHGHAQIFGWVGLFVMGFAYQAFPRFKHVDLAFPDLAFLSFWLMLIGLLVRSVLEPVAATQAWAYWPAVGAAGLEVVAIVLFVVVLTATWRASGKPLAFYDWYIVSALAWFVVQAVYEGVYLAATLSATGADLVPLVATWQAPLRDLQIHGFATLMILGVSQRLLHHVYGFPTPAVRLSRVALVLLNLAVLGEATGLVLMRLHDHAWAGLWYGSVLVLTVAAAALVGNWRLFTTRPADKDRSLKFMRAAYAWLFVSLAMLVALPAYQYALLPWLAPDSAAAGAGFSHAYYGATRHAITVGFISLMIVGVAAKVVPTLNGVEGATLPRLWLPFVLINAGCTLRVIGQVLTDFTSASFPLTGVSGVFEVTGLAVWGVHLWQIMSGTYLPAPVKPAETRGVVASGDLVGPLLDRHPELLPTLLSFGFRPLANPILRRTMARGITLAAACRFAGVEVEQLVATLNAELARGPGGTRSLPVVDPEPPTHAGCTCCEERKHTQQDGSLSSSGICATVPR